MEREKYRYEKVKTIQSYVIFKLKKKKKSGANVHYKMDGTFGKDLISYVCILVY